MRGTGSPSAVTRNTLRQQIAEALRDEVLAGRLRPGQAFTVKEIAEQYGVSSTPVREALVDLCAQGLLDSDQHRGFKVHRFSVDDYRGMVEARALIADGLFRALARRGPDAAPHGQALVSVRRRAEEAARAARGGDLDILIGYDLRFWRELGAIVANRYIGDFLHRLRVQSWVFAVPYLRGDASLSDWLWGGHEQLIDAVARGDAATAGAVVRAYNDHALSWADRLEARHVRQPGPAPRSATAGPPCPASGPGPDAAGPPRPADVGLRDAAVEPPCPAAGPGSDAAESPRLAAGSRDAAVEPPCPADGPRPDAAGPPCPAAGSGLDAAGPPRLADVGSRDAAVEPLCPADGSGPEATEPPCSAAGSGLDAAGPPRLAAGQREAAAGPPRLADVGLRDAAAGPPCPADGPGPDAAESPRLVDTGPRDAAAEPPRPVAGPREADRPQPPRPADGGPCEAAEQ